MTCNPAQLPCDLGRWQHEIHGATGDGVTGHTKILRAVLVLRKGHPASGLDRLEPQGAIGGRAREHDADRGRSDLIGQRAQHEIDRQLTMVTAGALATAALCQLQSPGAHREAVIGWRHVDMVRRDPGAVFGLPHRQIGLARHDLAQQTLAGRRRKHPDLRQALRDTLDDLNRDPFQPKLKLHSLSGNLGGAQAVSRPTHIG